MSGRTALVTSVGSDAGRAVIRGLNAARDPAFRVIAVDADPAALDAVAGAARCAPVPKASDPGYVDAVLELVRSEGIEVALPVYEDELLPLAQRAEELRAAGCAPVLNTPTVLDACLDKLAFGALAAQGLPIPETLSEAELRGGELPFPLILKRRRGRRLREPVVVRDEAELTRALDKAEHELIGQRLVAGQEYTVELVCAPSGELLAAIPRQRLRVERGVCVEGRLVEHAGLEALARELCETLRFSGPANLQAFEDTAGALHLIEVNPKFPGGGALTIAAGINPPLLLARAHLGLPVEFSWGASEVVSCPRGGSA